MCKDAAHLTSKPQYVIPIKKRPQSRRRLNSSIYWFTWGGGVNRDNVPWLLGSLLSFWSLSLAVLALRRSCSYRSLALDCSCLVHRLLDERDRERKGTHR